MCVYFGVRLIISRYGFIADHIIVELMTATCWRTLQWTQSSFSAADPQTTAGRSVLHSVSGAPEDGFV